MGRLIMRKGSFRTANEYEEDGMLVLHQFRIVDIPGLEGMPLVQERIVKSGKGIVHTLPWANH